ncbi:hypothetical protein POSPLADRAFT_1062663 [Postia placenta MAD-698-R-SB12]|uniref:Uncharacterized protein n=1 Tax=Postia placenta MAD-698-R-SB12 TaxID=670580 RepID=A0A1X6MJV2_9APHY|nr:hypothetical protein POSPLADRAFT_1062663 [Postia placenta MAD-698-R-SB12]OSX56516.1 hypothetical protein POSPLADRAFT_1062663 [Postia placenta MAD-698-R-SB12]
MPAYPAPALSYGAFRTRRLCEPVQTLRAAASSSSSTSPPGRSRRTVSVPASARPCSSRIQHALRLKPRHVKQRAKPQLLRSPSLSPARLALTQRAHASLTQVVPSSSPPRRPRLLARAVSSSSPSTSPATTTRSLPRLIHCMCELVRTPASACQKASAYAVRMCSLLAVHALSCTWLSRHRVKSSAAQQNALDPMALTGTDATRGATLRRRDARAALLSAGHRARGRRRAAVDGKARQDSVDAGARTAEDARTARASKVSNILPASRKRRPAASQRAHGQKIAPLNTGTASAPREERDSDAGDGGVRSPQRPAHPACAVRPRQSHSLISGDPVRYTHRARVRRAFLIPRSLRPPSAIRRLPHCAYIQPPPPPPPPPVLQSSDQDANCPRCRAPSIDLTTPTPPNLVGRTT